MAKDRLAALKPVGGDDDGLPDLIPQTNIKVEDDESDSIDKFFQQVEEVLMLINTISDNVKKVKAKHGDILADPNTDTKLKQELEQLMADIKRLSNKVRAILKLIKQEIEESGETESMMSANYRIKQTQCNTLSKKFVDVMNDYNECQVTYRQKCKERIQRQLTITGRDTTDEEIEDMIESGNPQIFSSGIVMETQAAKKSLADIEARHEDIMKLENSIRELHDMFVDMAVLVESQGTMIDRIEYNVSQAVNYVQDAVVNTNKALKYQRSARRKKIIIICVVVAIIVIILICIIVPVVVKNGGNKDNGGGGNDGAGTGNGNRPDALTPPPPRDQS